MNEILPYKQACGILDNGCGSGSIISNLLDTFGTEIPDNARIKASDFSTHMLESFQNTNESKTSSLGAHDHSHP
jgi:ubiquinone/menaquinone biosynthesis C-methylase UbiE